MESFSPQKLKVIVFWMHGGTTSGPDGFVIAFFKHVWGALAPNVVALADSFYGHDVDFSGMNISYVALLPKVAAL